MASSAPGEYLETMTAYSPSAYMKHMKHESMAEKERNYVRCCTLCPFYVINPLTRPFS